MCYRSRQRHPPHTPRRYGAMRAPSASLVGRDREFRILRELLPAAGAPRGGLAFLVGEPGIGKTALAHAFADEGVVRGATVLWGACLEGDWQPPYGPWAEALGARASAI